MTSGPASGSYPLGVLHEDPTAPRFTLITAVYNVSAYLDAFIASIESQKFPLDRVEVVAVDDGSTDDSLAKLRAWAERRPGLVKVFTKDNGGQATARNLGLEHARGEWVTFPDPDDLLEPDYLSEVDAFLSSHPTTQMVATNRILLDDATGKRSPHPLQRHFEAGNKLRDLDRYQELFHGSAPCAFFRTDRVNELGLRFDPEIRPNFEDGHFCVLYLLAAERPLVAFIATAEYLYRKRSDSSSTLNRSLLHPGRYTTVVERGYIDALRRSKDARGAVPEWLQAYILYELSWYLSSQEAVAGVLSAAHEEVADRFHELMRELVSLLDETMVQSFRLRGFKRVWREILLHGYDDEPWHTSFALVDALDEDQRLTRVTYRYTHDAPQEQFMLNGVPVEPVHHKVRDLVYHDRVMLHERIAWLPSGTLRLFLNGAPVPMRVSEPSPLVHALKAAPVRREHGRERLDASSRYAGGGRGRAATPKGGLIGRLAASAPVRRRFHDAWVMMDRIHDADDSGEQLFRYLRAERPDVNAWFVIEGGTPDFQRLRGQYGRRVVAHGTLEWKLLMANCVHLASSHADRPVTHPPQILAFHTPGWRFTFLQHGVIKDDLSNWLNPKQIDLFVTSTEAERQSIVGDHTSYTYTTKEVRLTGLPRFDAVRAEGERFPPEKRDLVLVAPTWRNWLVPPLRAGSQRRTVDPETFMVSDYARNWLGLLSSPELEAAARRHGVRIGFLPHPNIQPVLDHLDLPDIVQPLGFTDVRQLFARARVLVTDYSSMAFNTAYIDRPTVYFQFDLEAMMGGGHVGRQGYFDYERDGFGPVAKELQDAVAAVVRALDEGPDPEPMYQKRIAEAFPERDGRCSERVVAEMEALTRPHRGKRKAAAATARRRRRLRSIPGSAVRRARRMWG